MSEDSAKAREQLEQLAREGRAEAETQHVAKVRAQAQFEQERQQELSRAARLSTLSAWRSTSWWLDLALLFGVPSVFSLAPAAAFGFLPWSIRGLGVSALCLSLAWWSRGRARAFIRSHPFPVLGYGEALHHPAHNNDPDGSAGTQEATIHILFVDRLSEGKTLRDALHAKAGRYFRRANYGGRKLELALRGPSESGVDGHRRWLHRTMRRISPVLRAAHAIMPIESVTVEGD